MLQVGWRSHVAWSTLEPQKVMLMMMLCFLKKWSMSHPPSDCCALKKGSGHVLGSGLPACRSAGIWQWVKNQTLIDVDVTSVA